MSAAMVIELIQRALIIGLMVSAPLLLTALVSGVVVSLLQAVTQVQEQTLTFIPKLLAVALVLIITLPWMLRTLVEYLVESLRTLPMVAG